MTPGHSFMLADVLHTLAAVGLFPLFVLIPGYTLAWLADLFDFRRRSVEFRIALSVPLSISVCPIAIYLVGRFGSMAAVWGLFAIVWLGFLAILVRSGGPGRMVGLFTRNRALLTIAAIWAGLALFSLVDLQLGHRLYFSTIALDYSVRTEFIHSISTTGIPPANPFFYPGHHVPIRYHYFWLLLCSLVEQAGGSWVGPRAAWVASAIWCGAGFMALVALYFRLFRYQGAESFQRRAVLGVALLGVTGLDIIPAAGLWILRASGMAHAVMPSVEWWNEQVDGFVFTSLWEAHYLAGLVACLTALLLLWEAPRQQSVAGRWKYAAIAGLALASATGTAIYISFVFAAFLGIWTILTLWKRWWQETAVLAVAGAIAALLFAPYAADLRGPASSSGPLLELWVRPFSPVNAIAQGMGTVRGPALALLNGLMLPLNYFLELGFFFAAAWIWWKERRRNPKPLSRTELALAIMVATSVIICTFVRSSVIGNNDLGWRGFLIAQFGLLLWSVDVLADGVLGRRKSLVVLLALGILGTAYDVLLLRVFPILADAGIVAPAGWMAPDRQCGTRGYAAREAWEWADAAVPANARIQYDPHAILQDTYAFLYSNRQIVAGDETCFSGFGGDPALCPEVVTQVNRLYPTKGNAAPVEIGEVCRSLPVDLLVVRDTDAVWRDSQSWVWHEKPIFANAYFRMFGCAMRQ